MIGAIRKLFQIKPHDPALELARKKRAREAELEASGASNKQARLQVAREFSRK